MSRLELDDRGILVACPNCGQKNRVAFDRLSSAVRCGKCRHDMGTLNAPLDVASVSDFDAIVQHASIPIVVDYWAPWCGPCRMVAPELAKVAAKYAGHWLVLKVNTDQLYELGERYGIRSIPTMAVFAEGRELARTSGARPAADIEDFVGHATRDLERRERTV